MSLPSALCSVLGFGYGTLLDLVRLVEHELLWILASATLRFPSRRDCLKASLVKVRIVRSLVAVRCVERQSPLAVWPSLRLGCRCLVGC